MRQAVLLAPMIALALLTGCAGGEKQEERFSLWREEFNAAQGRTLEAEVTAISAESETVFTLRCESGGEGESVTVIKPDYLAGVTAHTDGESAKLQYDGAVLALGDAAAQQASPMTALPELFRFLREGHIESAWTETIENTNYLVAELENAESAKMQLWLEESSMQPRFAAIRSGDEAELKINIQKIE